MIDLVSPRQAAPHSKDPVRLEPKQAWCAQIRMKNKGGLPRAGRAIFAKGRRPLVARIIAQKMRPPTNNRERTGHEHSTGRPRRPVAGCKGRKRDRPEASPINRQKDKINAMFHRPSRRWKIPLSSAGGRHGSLQHTSPALYAAQDYAAQAKSASGAKTRRHSMPRFFEHSIRSGAIRDI